MNFVSSESNKSVEPRKVSKVGLYLIGLTGGIATAISVVCIPFWSPAFRRICVPFVPATEQQVENVLNALRGRSGSLIDLGSGDGRVVFAAANAGFKAHGVELNPWLVWYSRFKALTTGLSSKTSFVKKDLWKHNLSSYDNVVVIGVEQMMQDVEGKCLAELREDSTIITCRNPLPSMNPMRIIGTGIDRVWIYKMPKRSLQQEAKRA